MDFAIVGLDHVQLAMPAGGESAAETFYAGVLGFNAVPKPEPMASRGGCWFETGTTWSTSGWIPTFGRQKRPIPPWWCTTWAHSLPRLERRGSRCAPIRIGQRVRGATWTTPSAIASS